MLNFCDFIQVYVFTTNHHLKSVSTIPIVMVGGTCEPLPACLS